MSCIFFKREYLDAIRRGEKTTTLRRWKSRRLRGGTRAFAPGFGYLSILSCEEVKLKDLSPADARADGFASLRQLRKTLARIYPNCAKDGRRWFRVVFAPENSPNSPTGCARRDLARQIRAELDKVVRQSGSWLRI
jgi:hypothetical protein